MSGKNRGGDQEVFVDAEIVDVISPSAKSKLKRNGLAKEEYDKGVDELISSLQYFFDESKISFKTPLVYGAFATAEFWSKPIKLESVNDYILLPFRLIAELIALIVGLLGTAILAIPTAPELHKLSKNMDKMQDPKVLSTLLSDEKFWDFAINHISALRSIAVRSADPSNRGLLTSLLTKEVMNDFKSTFSNPADKAFLKEILSLALDKDFKKLPKEKQNEKIREVVCADGFREFLVNLSSNQRLFEVLCAHPLLNEVLNTSRVPKELVVEAITGPVRDLLEKPIVQEMLKKPTAIEALLAGKIPDDLQFTKETLPEFLTTVVTDEELWNFVVEHIDKIRVAAIKNSPEAQQGLLNDLLDKRVLKGVKQTFAGDVHKKLFKDMVALAFEQDKPIHSKVALKVQVQKVLGLEKSIEGTSQQELQDKVSKTVGTKQYSEFIKDFSLKQLMALSYDSTLNWDIRVFFRAESVKRMSVFMGSEEFHDFIRDFATKDVKLLRILSRHSPVKEALDQFGLSQDLLIKLVTGPLKKRPEDLKEIFQSLNNGRLVQKMLELVRDHPDVYGTFARDNAQALRWPIDKFLNDNCYWIDNKGVRQVFLKPIHDALRQFLPNLDFSKVVGAAMEMSKDDLTAMIKTFDMIMKPEIGAKDKVAGVAHSFYSKLYSTQQFATAAQVPYHAQLGSFMTILNLLRFAPLADMDRIRMAKQLGKLAGSDVVVESFLTNQAKEKASGKTSLPAAFGIVTYDENGQKHNFLAEYLKDLNKTEAALDVASFPLYFILGYDPVDMYRQTMGSSAQPGVVESLVEFNKRQAKPFQDAVVQAVESSEEPDLSKRFKAFHDWLPTEIRSRLEYYKLNFKSLDYLNLEQLDLSKTTVENFTIFNSVFNECDFTEMELIGSRFSNTAILNSKLNNSVLHKCEFDNFDCTGSSFKGAIITECEFNGKIQITSDALKGATIDSTSLNSLIKACERSGVVLDLASVKITGDPYSINWLSPAIKNHDKALAGDRLKLRNGHTLSKLRTLQIITSIDALLPSDKNIARIESLFRADENDIVTTYLANNFRYKNMQELESYSSPAGKINYLINNSLKKGDIRRPSLRRKVLSTVLAEDICKEIFPNMSFFGFAATAEEQFLANFISKTTASLEIKSKELQKMFELDDKGQLRLKPEHKKLVEGLTKLIKAHAVGDLGEPLGVTLDTLKHPDLQAMMPLLIESYSKNQRIDLQGMVIDTGLYLKAKDVFKMVGLKLSKEFSDYHELLLVMQNVDLNNTQENIKLMQKLVNGNDWVGQYLKDKMRFEGAVQSREQLAEVHKHFKDIKDSPQLVLSDIKACVKDGKLGVDEFRLRIIANKIADQVSKRLFGDANNRAKDCLLLQEVVMAALDKMSIKDADGKVFTLKEKVESLERMFENAQTVKPAYEKVIENLSAQIKEQYCVKTKMGAITGGIQLDRQISKDALSKKSYLYKLIKKLLSFSIINFRAERPDSDEKSVDRLSDLSKKMSENIATGLWGEAGIKGHRKADFGRLSEFMHSFVTHVAASRHGYSASKTYEEIYTREEYYTGVIKKQLEASALCSTAMGKFAFTEGTQLKSDFSRTKVSKQLRDDIMASIYPELGGKGV